MTSAAQAAYAEAEAMPDQGLVETLIVAIRLLAARGLATAEDYRTLEQIEGADMALQLSFIAGQQSGISPFEAIRHADDHGEYWLARELQSPLEYTRWEYFQQAIDRARQSCKNSGEDVKYHFRDATKMIEIGKGGQRPVIDYRLSKHACYLVLMNGDPRKQIIADAQAYFVEKTRQQEVTDEENTIRQTDGIQGGYAPSLDLLAIEQLLELTTRTVSYIRRMEIDNARRDRDIAEIKETLRGKQEEAEAPLLPATTVEAPEKTTRMAVIQLVRSAAHRRGTPHSFLFSALYREFRDRTHHDVLTIANNRDVQVIDVVEELGLMEELYSIAHEMYGEGD